MTFPSYTWKDWLDDTNGFEDIIESGTLRTLVVIIGFVCVSYLEPLVVFVFDRLRWKNEWLIDVFWSTVFWFFAVVGFLRILMCLSPVFVFIGHFIGCTIAWLLS